MAERFAVRDFVSDIPDVRLPPAGSEPSPGETVPTSPTGLAGRDCR
jgi:hypothetical protein